MIQEKLNEIVSNIKQQHIKLIHLKLDANEKIGGVFQENIIGTKLKISIDSIASATITTHEHSSLPAISCGFSFYLEYSIKDKENSNELAIIEAKYLLQIVLEKHIEDILKDIPEDEKGNILYNFFNNTGKIIIFPYFRNIIDILMRECGFTLPPLNPLAINNK